ncbi:MAG TPA: oxygenase MpaB family protein [Nocardioidaceae bacterium]|nr:oxygenase MpaB family protein [Nocardioidaceae bacterium]
MTEPAYALEPRPEPLGPDSLWYRVGLPRTLLLLAGRPLLLQVCHPVIGAGVRDFSVFRQDPWGRLDRSVTSLELQIFGGRRAIEESDRLRTMHREIKGTGFNGERYSALHPGAYAWTHLSTFDTILKMADLVGYSGIQPRHHERLYAEWRQVGLVLGIKDHHMPENISDLHDYVNGMVTRELGGNETAYNLLDTLALRDVPPPAGLPGPVWQALKPFGATVLHDFTVGTLPPHLREELGLEWTRKDQVRLTLMAKAVHTVSPGVPGKLMQYPLAYEATRAARNYRTAGSSA